MKGKVGILTFHSSFNEGAIWQAYCLAQNLQRNLPEHNVEVINHRYLEKTRAYGPPVDGRTQALSRFTNTELPLSDQRFENNSHQDTYKYINRRYQGIIVGSDQVWKLKYNKRLRGLVIRQDSPMYPAFPNVYWPDTGLQIPKIAYAVSIGRTDWRTISQTHQIKMRKFLSDFSLLGVRDQRTLAFLEWLDTDTAKRAEWVPDPTFSFDSLSLVNKNLLKQKLEQYGVDFSRPRLGVIVRNTQVTNMVIQQLKEKGYQVVGLTERNPVSDVELFEKDFTPLEWASIAGFMDFVLTQRMHGAISCILNNTPFVGIAFTENRIDGDSTLKDLMRSFNLQDYYYSSMLESVERLKEICDFLIEDSWPSGLVNQKRVYFQCRSREFTAKIKQLIETGS